jgi:hypothetical protein
VDRKKQKIIQNKLYSLAIKRRFKSCREHICSLPAVIASFLLLLVSANCSTGIESTKKIELSRQDRKFIEPTAEEKFLVNLKRETLKEWKIGKVFYAPDDKVALIFDSYGLPSDPLSLHLGGEKMTYIGYESSSSPINGDVTLLHFLSGDNTYTYVITKPIDKALEEFTSTDVPMLIDEDIVSRAHLMLKDKIIYPRTQLWYGKDDAITLGRKYIPVTVDSVTEGNMIFPLKVIFTDNTGLTASLYMNIGEDNNESRSFSNLFTLDNPQKKYPNTDPEVWDIICAGSVRIGMTKEECRLSLGNPAEVDTGHDYSQTLDLWKYNDGTTLWFEDGILTRIRN